MDLNLKNLRALITGASRGIGYAIALELACEGCQIAINSRSADTLQPASQSIHEQTGASVYTSVGDVTDASAAKTIVQEAVRLMGGLDLLITNAGGPPPGRFESFDNTAWSHAIDLSFLSHVRLIRSALPHLRQSNAASVLTIASYSVKQPLPNLVLSNSIRSATVGLTKSLALELGPDGIRFNSILPAWTETERVRELMANRAQMNATTLDEEIAKQARESPFGRMAKPVELAKPAVFLLSPAASYITGVMLTVDGGMYKGML